MHMYFYSIYLGRFGSSVEGCCKKTYWWRKTTMLKSILKVGKPSIVANQRLDFRREVRRVKLY